MVGDGKSRLFWWQGTQIRVSSGKGQGLLGGYHGNLADLTDMQTSWRLELARQERRLFSHLLRSSVSITLIFGVFLPLSPGLVSLLTAQKPSS